VVGRAANRLAAGHTHIVQRMSWPGQKIAISSSVIRPMQRSLLRIS
jgi:hypothetical protein